MKKIERKCRTGHVERISFTVYKIKLTFKGIAKIKKGEINCESWTWKWWDKIGAIDLQSRAKRKGKFR